MKTPKHYAELQGIFWAYCSIIWHQTTAEGRRNWENIVFRFDLNKNEKTKKEYPYLLEHGTKQSYTVTVGNWERIRYEMQNFMEDRTLFNSYTKREKKEK